MFSSTKASKNSPTTSAGGITLFTAGTYSVAVPSDVTSVTAIAIGAGGGGGGATAAASSSAGGGGGGALSYGNITVTPNETLTVVVGTAGSGGASTGTSGTAGGDSYIRRSATDLLLAKGGGGGGGATGTQAGTGGSGGASASGVGTVKQSGGSGGNGNTNDRGGGGGGGAGYTGSGGAGGSGTTAPTSIAGGGGGGGYFGYDGTTLQTGGNGGGTLFYGPGSSGAAGTASGAAAARSGDLGSSLGGDAGFAGAAVNQTPGGSGGGASSAGTASTGGNGYSGAVRMLWGNSAAFPSTNVTNSGVQLVASASSSASTITVPDGVRPGDSMVLFDYATNSGSSPTAVTPSGFTNVNNDSANGYRLLMGVRTVLSTDEVGGTLTGMTGSTIQKILMVFRGTTGYSSIAASTPYNTGGTGNWINTTSAPSAATIADAAYDGYAQGLPISIVFFSGTSGITPGTDLTFSGATFLQGTSNLYYVGYKIYTQATTSFSDTVSMLDRGSNTMVAYSIGGY